MTRLDNIRIDIDTLDKELIKLFEKRMDLVKNVIEYKIKNNIDILDNNREEYILEKNRKLLKNEKYSEYLDDLFIEIMRISKNMQNQILKELSND
ncbi:chorismate mutase [Miniphocaeibacter massiliensis]|uniref:chorismate mutase n=1 Tax=Miniphocaeibacter massiliensis TaxID=2041841 RepID=UPI000C1C2A5B|nr:chorismate mutase [Miniphocaeibacter massiliensis]